MNTTVWSIFCAGIIFFSVSILKWAIKHLRLRKKLSSIPQFDTLPFIGLAWQLKNIPVEDIFDYNVKSSFQFKDGISVVWLGTNAHVAIRKPHQLEVILRSRTLITKGDFYNYLSVWLKNGLLTSTGEIWHKSRRLITPAFHFNILDDFIDVIAEKVDILNNQLEKLIDGDKEKIINIFSIAIKFTLETTLKTVMGLDLEKGDRSVKNEYVKALHTFATLTIDRFIVLPYRSDFIFYRTKKGKEYLKALETLHSFTIGVINEKKTLREADKKIGSDYEIGTKKTKAFLDLLMDAAEADENSLSLEELREQVDTFMFAGHDTTGAALSYTLFCLGNVPEIQKKVQEEIKEVFGDKNEPITKDNLVQLKLLERVIKESLRLFPSAPGSVRVLDHDVIIDGYTIPKGIEIELQIIQTHRDPDVWEDPLKFDPDRFLPENSQGRHPYAYIPFSAGPRNCIGQKFAMLVLKIALVGILRKWTFSSDVKIEDAKLSAILVLTPPNKTINLLFKSIDND